MAPAYYDEIYDPTGATADTANTNTDGQTGSIPTLASGVASKNVKIKKLRFSGVYGTDNILRVWKKKTTFSVMLFQRDIEASMTKNGTWVWTWEGEIELETSDWSLVFSTHNGDDIKGLAFGVQKAA